MKTKNKTNSFSFFSSFKQEEQQLLMNHISMLVVGHFLFCNILQDDEYDFQQELNEIWNLYLYDYVPNVYE
jgi:hypothetical protein